MGYNDLEFYKSENDRLEAEVHRLYDQLDRLRDRNADLESRLRDALSLIDAFESQEKDREAAKMDDFESFHAACADDGPY